MRFFHSSATTRRKKNHIEYLVNDNNVNVTDHEGMCDIVLNYFSSIFSGQADREAVNSIQCSKIIIDAQNNALTGELKFEEFTLAVKQMHPDKATGPGGLNLAFFQAFWKIMGNEMFQYCKRWLDTNCFPNDLNSTNVVLIPKKENAVFMKDLRPIALCNVLYKIMAKVLANRIKIVLPGVNAENQSAFVHGRNITDNMLIAFDMIHHMRLKNRGLEREVALKLDIVS